MDIAAHNATVDWVTARGECRGSSSVMTASSLQPTHPCLWKHAASFHLLTGTYWPPAGTRQKYKNFIFLNSSVRGPFTPHYLPPGWQWTQALTSRLSDTVKVRGSSFICQKLVGHTSGCQAVRTELLCSRA